MDLQKCVRLGVSGQDVSSYESVVIFFLQGQSGDIPIGNKKFFYTKEMVRTLMRQVLADTPDEKTMDGWPELVNNLKSDPNFTNISVRTARDRALAEVKKFKAKDRENRGK